MVTRGRSTSRCRGFERRGYAALKSSSLSTLFARSHNALRSLSLDSSQRLGIGLSLRFSCCDSKVSHPLPRPSASVMRRWLTTRRSVPARRSVPCHGIVRGRRRSPGVALLSTRVGWESHTCQYAPSLSTKVRYPIRIYHLTADHPRSLYTIQEWDRFWFKIGEKSYDFFASPAAKSRPADSPRPVVFSSFFSSPPGSL